MKNCRALETDGTALIEAAISLPLLLLMLFGMAELGKLIYCGIEVTNSARAAAQYAAMNGGAFSTTDASGLDTTGMLNAAWADSENLGQSVSFSTIPSYSCSCSDGSGTYSCNVKGAIPSGCASSHLIVTVTVRTQGSFTPDLHIVGLPNSFTLQGHSVQEVLQ